MRVDETSRAAGSRFGILRLIGAVVLITGGILVAGQLTKGHPRSKPKLVSPNPSAFHDMDEWGNEIVRGHLSDNGWPFFYRLPKIQTDSALERAYTKEGYVIRCELVDDCLMCAVVTRANGAPLSAEDEKALLSHMTEPIFWFYYAPGKKSRIPEIDYSVSLQAGSLFIRRATYTPTLVLEPQPTPPAAKD